MKCPKCKAPMDNVVLEGVQIERCSGCKGLWFDANEEVLMSKIQHAEMLDLGLASLGKEFNNEEPIFCPRCGTSSQLHKLQDKKQPHIELDRCNSCNGTFFDAGEFTDFKKHDVLDFFKSLARKARG
ncbi:MAG TPA: zf-TFIIB domain-containing protein [Permianibacter sp.]|nr:zf-TFIIB domain-containing protein [Permianibacter sp.]